MTTVGRSRWLGTPRLPYINNIEYLTALELHADTRPSPAVLLAWGAKSVSKSGGLQLMMQRWRKQGDIVIDVDLKGSRLTLDDFAVRFRERC
jgi:hypothetical protein